MTPFQCDICHFRNIQHRDPCVNAVKDMRLMQAIRQANIDAFWSRETSTVNGNLIQARRMEHLGDYYGIASVSPALGPFPLEDTFGMKTAVCVLKRSLDKGRTEEHVQFATTRKLRSAYSNVYHASKELVNVSAMAFESTKTYSTTCPTYGYWFERFILGVHKRMGDVVVSDFALSQSIFKELVHDLELDWAQAQSEDEREKLVDVGNVIIMGYLLALRGEEIVKVDASGFLKYLDVGARHEEYPHVIVPLIGRLKGETGERYHLLPMARVTKSGIMAGRWADRLGQKLLRKGWRNGFVFRRADNKQAKTSDYNDEFIDRLGKIKMLKPHLFDPTIMLGDAYNLR